ncbi:hypothetical protein NAF17_14295 [Mucilaginibacter sp. RB4R14]|uniref:hypothetical protein n=1 Tax=Mucilaginibacter aurantiaciroseus TaxID=2949308 RepID=UPI0020901B77|nr:hypothetical protein [Mucilaginibacter aurantiaciroseus]MCO5936710.1 hypothetical protein [Mucilaginibacter aurantiaciroseus]
MKTLKRSIFIKSLLLILVVAFLGGCKKDSDGGSGGDMGSGKGTFTIKGNPYSGMCQSVPATSGVSGNIDVIIASQSGASFTIYNMPTSSSGSSNVSNFDTDNAGFTDKLYAISIVNQSASFYSLSGSVTKTGVKSYKFSVTMMDQTTNGQTTATGSGNY